MKAKNVRLLLMFAMLLTITIVVVFSNRKSSLGGREERFAVNDTASVALVTITHPQNGSVELQRTDGQWIVSGHAPVRPDFVPILLKTIHDIAKTKPVAKAESKKMIAEMDKSGYTIKIEGRRKTMAHYRLLFASNGECFAQTIGSDRVFAVEVPGYGRFLSVLRMSSPADWKNHTVFAIKPDLVRQIIFDNPAHPDRSFVIKHSGRQNELFSYPVGLKITDADADKLERYVAQFAHKEFDDYTQLTQQTIDSITATQPIYTLSVTTSNGHEMWCRAYVRPLPDGNADPDNFYMLLSNGDFVQARYFNFDPVVKSLGYFKAGN